MYRRFAFEGDIHVSLSCVPLAVRRKLDLAGLKVSLKGWQALARPERLALCHLPVETGEEIAVYREVLQGFAARAGVDLSPLPPADPIAWGSGGLPDRVASRLAEIGEPLDAARWSAFDEEERYCVWKYADPRREPEKLRLLLGELTPPRRWPRPSKDERDDRDHGE